MPTIIACPNCHQDVSLPSRVEGPLICPHCDGEFSFLANSSGGSRVTHGDVPFAPSTVDVSPETVAEESDLTPQARSARRDTSAASKPATYHDADFSRGPRESSGGSHRVIDEFPDDDADVECFDPDNPPDYDTSDYGDGNYDVEPDDDLAPNPSLEIKTASSGSSDPRARVVGSRSRRNRNPLGQLLGVIGGGVLGLTIGYYLLNYFGGPQFNFLNLQLPGIPPQPAQAEEGDSGDDQNQTRRDNRGSRQVDRPNGRGTTRQNESSRNAVDPASSAYTPPVFSAVDLQTALAAASRSVGCEHCEGVGTVTQRVFGGANSGNRVDAPCPACQGNPYAHVTQSGYRSLCELARTVTWVDSNDAAARGSVEALRRFLLQTSKSPEQRAQLNEFAVSRLMPNSQQVSATAARTGDGILLVGKIAGRSQEGSLYLTTLDLQSSETSAAGNTLKQIVVVSAAQAPGLLGESLLVAGAVLHNPRTTLPEYQGQESLVIWGGFPLVVR